MCNIYLLGRGSTLVIGTQGTSIFFSSISDAMAVLLEAPRGAAIALGADADATLASGSMVLKIKVVPGA